MIVGQVYRGPLLIFKIPKLVYYGVKREIQQVGIACRRYQIKQQTYKQQNVFEVKIV